MNMCMHIVDVIFLHKIHTFFNFEKSMIDTNWMVDDGAMFSTIASANYFVENVCARDYYESK